MRQCPRSAGLVASVSKKGPTVSTQRLVRWKWPWASTPKEGEPESLADHYLKDLQRSGKVATGALAVVTAVLGVFGIREGIPQRILRDQPVATLISFMLIGLAILLAGLSIFSFDKDHPKLAALSVLSKRWLLCICTFSVIFLVVWAACHRASRRAVVRGSRWSVGRAAAGCLRATFVGNPIAPPPRRAANRVIITTQTNAGIS